MKCQAYVVIAFDNLSLLLIKMYLLAHLLLGRSAARCSVEALAYGANDISERRDGFVKLNGVVVWQSSWFGNFSNLRGVSTVVVDPFRCSAEESRRFDTFKSATDATQLRDYLRQLNRGALIVGATADEPTNRLSAALPALRDLGVRVNDVKYRGAFAFVAQKGFPDKTVLRKVLTRAQTVHAQPRVNIIITGRRYIFL